MEPILVTQSSMPDFNEFCEEIRDLWDNRWLTNMGVKHNELVEELQCFLKTPNVSLFSNGHLALECAIEAFQLNGEVITTPFTFASTTHAIVRKGLTPVFADINLDDYTIKTDSIERLITDKTSAIIPVHVYGNVCDVNEIERIATKYNLKVIYDAAHAFGIKVNDQGIANFGDASMFSFHATKVFHTIEGGALTYRDTRLKNKLDMAKNFGITGPESVEYVGGNAKMNEFQAVMGLCNLRYIDREVEKRKEIHERYIENLGGIYGIRLPYIQKGIASNYAYFPVLFNGHKISRDEIYHELQKHNIYSRKYFYPLTNNFQCYKSKFTPNDTPVAQYISERILTLPLYVNLQLDDVDRICDVIKTIIKGIKLPILKGDSLI